MKMKFEQFRLAAGLSEFLALRFYEPVENAMFVNSIVSPQRAACFIATIGHESQGFTRLVENLNYSAEGLLATFKKYYTPALAAAHARKPEQIANHVYANRMGNTAPGDGWRYRGRALIHITGKDNYEDMQAETGLNIVDKPEQLEQPEPAAKVSAAWWNKNGCNELADRANGLLLVSRKVNVGNENSTITPNGWIDRQARYTTAIRHLG